MKMVLVGSEREEDLCMYCAGANVSLGRLPVRIPWYRDNRIHKFQIIKNSSRILHGM